MFNFIGTCQKGFQNRCTILHSHQQSKGGLIVSFFFFFLINLFIYLFLAVLGLRFCARAFSSCGERGHSSLQCAGLSLSWPLLLWSTGSRRAGSVAVAHGPSCSAACGIFPDQGSNPCSLHLRQILNHCATREAQD